jgi:hypothetical protein
MSAFFAHLTQLDGGLLAVVLATGVALGAILVPLLRRNRD